MCTPRRAWPQAQVLAQSTSGLQTRRACRGRSPQASALPRCGAPNALPAARSIKSGARMASKTPNRAKLALS